MAGEPPTEHQRAIGVVVAAVVFVAFGGVAPRWHSQAAALSTRRSSERQRRLHPTTPRTTATRAARRRLAAKPHRAPVRLHTQATPAAASPATAAAAPTGSAAPSAQPSPPAASSPAPT